MRQTLTIAKRELMSQFYSPIAYVVMAIFALGAGVIFFAANFYPGARADMRDTFGLLLQLLIYLTPAISMRLISEEYRSGTIETLTTAPISDMQIVAGKWLGAVGFLLAMFVSLLVLIGMLEIHADPDYGPILTGLIGLVLVGSFFLAIGVFASAATQNQIVAFILGFSVICVFTYVMRSLPNASFVTNWWRQVMYYISVAEHLEDFNKGLFVMHHVVYFGTGTLLFLFFAVKLLESRRWR